MNTVYYGLSLYAINLGGNNYLNFFLSGAVEVPAYTLCTFTLKRFSRRTNLAAAFLLTGLALLLTGPIPQGEMLATARGSILEKKCPSLSVACQRCCLHPQK